MHNEEAVINYVCSFLESRKFRVLSRLSVHQRGYDIEALSPDGSQKIAIEAKGETATRVTSKTYGEPFSPGSVYTSVTTAYFCASTYGPKGYMAGIALPANDRYHRQVEEILPSLKTLRIEVFWVQPNGAVKLQNHWTLWDKA